MYAKKLNTDTYYTPIQLKIPIDLTQIIDISDEDAYEYTKLLPKVEGILIGISAGAALAGAVEVAKREENKDKNIVIIFPDGGDHYLSTPELFEV